MINLELFAGLEFELPLELLEATAVGGDPEAAAAEPVEAPLASDDAFTCFAEASPCRPCHDL